MTNRNITALAIRIGAFMLFIKIFDQFGTYFFSLYLLAVVRLTETTLNPAINKFYFNGTILMFANFIVSSFLFIKAEWVASKLIKNDTDLFIGLTVEQLIRVIVLTTGVIWLGYSIIQLPDLYLFVKLIILKIELKGRTGPVNFNLGYFLTKTILGYLFVFRLERVSAFLMSKMNKTLPKKDNKIVADEDNPI